MADLNDDLVLTRPRVGGSGPQSGAAVLLENASRVRKAIQQLPQEQTGSRAALEFAAEVLEDLGGEGPR